MRSLVFAFIVVLSGCATTPQPVFTATVAYETPEWLNLGITGTVEGSAFMRQRNGVVQSCAGREIYLIPATPYADERMTFIYGNTVRGRAIRNIGSPGSTPVDPRAEADWLRGVCDVQGKFIFDEVPAGRWYGVAAVYWEVPTGNQFMPFSTEGGIMMQSFEVKEGRKSTLVISP